MLLVTRQAAISYAVVGWARPPVSEDPNVPDDDKINTHSKHFSLSVSSQDVGEKGSSVSLIHEEDEIRTAIRVLVRCMVSACTQPQPLNRYTLFLLSYVCC